MIRRHEDMGIRNQAHITGYDHSLAGQATHADQPVFVHLGNFLVIGIKGSELRDVAHGTIGIMSLHQQGLGSLPGVAALLRENCQALEDRFVGQ